MTTTLWRTGLFLAMIGTGLTTAGAADLFWQGGGNWSDAAWATASGGPYSQPWTGGSNAVFETTAGAISVDTATSVGDMTYQRQSDDSRQPVAHAQRNHGHGSFGRFRHDLGFAWW